MKSYARTHLTDQDLLRNVVANRGREVTAFSDELADIAEIDARKLYLPAAHPSMLSWCVHVLGLSDDEAYNRIRAARIAREFPVIFEMLAERRLNLTAVCLLAPHLTLENAGEVLQAASRKSKCEVQQLIAERFPRSEMLTLVAGGTTEGQSGGQPVERKASVDGGPQSHQLVPERVDARSGVQPLSAESFELHLCIGRQTHENLRYAQALASHQVHAGDVAEVFDRALKAWIRELEKTRFAATARPRRGQRRPASIGRHISADVKRTVWERDGGQCTFESESGHRCPATELLQFDHVVPFARGGTAAAENIRLRCRAHNQFEADQAFGREFMDQKRAAAVEARAAARACKVMRAEAESETQGLEVEGEVPAHEGDHSIYTCMRQLGFGAEEARRAAAHCATMVEATLEEKVRAALRMLSPRAVRLDFRPATTAAG